MPSVMHYPTCLSCALIHFAGRDCFSMLADAPTLSLTVITCGPRLDIRGLCRTLATSHVVPSAMLLPHMLGA